MISAIIIDDDDKQFDDDFVLLIQEIEMNTSSMSDFVKLSEISKTYLPDNLKAFTTPQKFIIVNGEINPTMHLKVGYLYRLRIINSVPNGVLYLVFGESCHVDVIAADGVKFSSSRRINNSGLLIPSGSRRDLAVTCLKTTKIDEQIVSMLNDTTLLQQSVRSYIGSMTDVATGNVFRIACVFENGKNNSAIRYYVAKKPTGYTSEKFDSLQELTPDQQRTIHLTQSGPKSSRIERNGYFYPFLGFDNHLYGESIRYIVPLNKLIEWKIVEKTMLDGHSMTVSHPFHMHTNHFQIVSFNSSLHNNSFQPDFEVGDWRDTILIPAPGSVTIRFIPRDYIGISVFHCHILFHEDIGMMAKFMITD